MKHQFMFPKLALDLLIKIFGKRYSRMFTEAALQFKTFSEHLLTHHGRQMGCKLLKAIFGQAKRVLFGYRGEFILYPVWLQCDRNGLPIKLRLLNRLLTNRSRVMRVFAISVFASYLALRCAPNLDVASVISLPTSRRVKGLYRFIKEIFVPYVIQRAKDRKISLRPLKDLFLIKSDPYRNPSMMGSVLSGKVLLELYQSGDPFGLAIVKFIELQSKGLESIINRLQRLTMNFQLNSSHKPYRLMSLFAAPDRGGKTRIFTSAAYWVQFALYPLHDFLMKVLRTFPEDFTYKQDKSMLWMRAVSQSGQKMFSFDLTSATDRFCNKVQRHLLVCLFGQRFASLWFKIVTGPVYVGHFRKEGKTVKDGRTPIDDDFIHYQAGQPMGTYASWALFALCHHAVVRYCFWKLRVDFRFRYALLGDDVIIAHEGVAWKYHNLVTKYLGCDISLTKSYIPEGDLRPGEFAKQLISKGKDFTPLTPDLLESSVTMSWNSFPDIVAHALVRWGLKCGTNYTELPRIVSLCPRAKDRISAIVLFTWPSNIFIDLVPTKYWEELNDYIWDHAPTYGSYQIPDKDDPDPELSSYTGSGPYSKEAKYFPTISKYKAHLEDLELERFVKSLIKHPFLAFVDKGFQEVLPSLNSEQEVNQYLIKLGIDHPVARSTLRLYWKWSCDLPLKRSSTVAILRGLESCLEYSKPDWRSRQVVSKRTSDTTVLKTVRWLLKFEQSNLML